jgi:hypothetical protein
VAEAQHDVYARVAWAAIDLAVLGGLPRDKLFDGLPFDARSVRGLRRVAWSDYVTLCENIGALLGDGYEDLAEASYHHVYPELRSTVGALLDSKQLLRIIMTVANPLAFPPIEHRLEDLGGRHVRLSLRLRAGARPSKTWFRASIGALRGVPRYLDQPPAKVSAQIGPDYGIYDITLPANRTILGRLRNGYDRFDARLHRELIRWKMMRRQLEVLDRVRSDANQELAHVLECTNLVLEIIFAQLLQKGDRHEIG